VVHCSSRLVTALTDVPHSGTVMVLEITLRKLHAEFRAHAGIK
jgi:hypothetical protein